MTPWSIVVYYSSAGFVLAIGVDLMVKPVCIGYHLITDTLGLLIK